MANFPQPTKQQLGQTAYEAYRDHTAGLTWNGYPMPTWAELPHSVQGAWAAAGHRIHEQALADVVEWMSAEKELVL